jgi:diguanylate cyclase
VAVPWLDRRGSGAQRGQMPISRPLPPPDAAPPRLLQELADSLQRSRLGGPFYVLGWLVTWLASPAVQARPAWAAAIGALFVFGTVLRLRTKAREVTQRSEAERRIARVWWLVGATTALWGAAAAGVLQQGPEPDAQLVVLVCTVAYATAIAQGFCMRLGRALVVLALLYLPVLAALWLGGHARLGATAMAIYLFYVLLLLRRSQTEYRQRLDLEDDLRRQRDLFQQQSRRDGLTGLANRRRFESALAALVQEAPNRPLPFALLVFDLDHFKAINDRHGHAVGDACLREFAERLQRAFAGTQELVARLGGEEFAVLIEDTDEDAAAARGEAFRQLIAGTPLVLPEIAIGITVSIGVGAFGPRHDTDGEVFFSEVDQARYRAKADGRNALRRMRAEPR